MLDFFMAFFKLCHISGRWHLWAAFFLSDCLMPTWLGAVGLWLMLSWGGGGSKLRINKTHRVD